MKEDAAVQPFEWLTSPESLDPLVEEALNGIENARVLHVGCGTSDWGEHVLHRFADRCATVVNVDKNETSIRDMERRWNRSHHVDERMQFQTVDFLTDRVAPANSSGGRGDDFFHLILDKSTLDCTLCSDEMSAALLAEVYRNLHPDGGVYLLVSFHSVGLLEPLLRDLPGASWDVQHTVVMRQVEDLIRKKEMKDSDDDNDDSGKRRVKGPVSPDHGSDVAIDPSEPRSAWNADGCFQPDELYRRTVNVFLCRRHHRRSNDDDDLTSDAAAQHDSDHASQISQHVHAVSDAWYRTQNPLLTESRRTDLSKAFGGESSANVLDLPTCYRVLFTEEERDHLEYEYFLEDWQAFCTKRRGSGMDSDESGMTYEVALTFLLEMQ